MGDPVIDAMNDMVAERGEPDLVASGLVKIYGDRTVVNGMSVDCRCGEIVGLLGPNGAGKTTTFYMIVGLVKPNEGKVVFRGCDITRMPVYLRARRGLDIFLVITAHDTVSLLTRYFPRLAVMSTVLLSL